MGKFLSTVVFAGGAGPNLLFLLNPFSRLLLVVVQQALVNLLLFHVLADDEIAFPFTRMTLFEGLEEMGDALDPIVRELGWDSGRLAAWLSELPKNQRPAGPGRAATRTADPAVIVDAALSLSAQPEATRLLERDDILVALQIAASSAAQTNFSEPHRIQSILM